MYHEPIYGWLMDAGTEKKAKYWEEASTEKKADVGDAGCSRYKAIKDASRSLQRLRRDSATQGQHTCVPSGVGCEVPWIPITCFLSLPLLIGTFYPFLHVECVSTG